MTEFPAGTMYGNHTPGLALCLRTFATAADPDRGHRCGPAPDPNADDLPPETCGRIAGLPLAHFGRLDPGRPSLHRMAAALRAAGIEPRVWTGDAVVPFDSWLETAREHRPDRPAEGRPELHAGVPGRDPVPSDDP